MMYALNPVSGLMVKAIPCHHCGLRFAPSYGMPDISDRFCLECRAHHYIGSSPDNCPTCHAAVSGQPAEIELEHDRDCPCDECRPVSGSEEMEWEHDTDCSCLGCQDQRDAFDEEFREYDASQQEHRL